MIVQSVSLDIRESSFDSQQEQEIYLFAKESRPVHWPTHPSIQRAPGTLCSGVRRPGREADNSPAEVKNELGIPPVPHTSS